MKEELKNKFIDAVKKDVGMDKQVGLFFSGGIDSSLIGKILKDLDIDVIPITIGLKNSKDLIFTKNISKELFKKNVLIEINEKTLEKIIPKVVNITKSRDVLTISVGCVIYLASKYSSILGLKKVFTGTGSDEIFCGYNSHKKALMKSINHVKKECKNRLVSIKKDLDRDKSITEHFELELKTPFLNEDIIKIGMNTPINKKIDEENEKIILRELCIDINLPECVCQRKKIAAQYGSGVQKIIKRISKKEGFDTIGNFLKNVYKKQINM